MPKSTAQMNCGPRQPRPCLWSAAEYDELRKMMTKSNETSADSAPWIARLAHDTAARIARLDPASGLEEEAAMAKGWTALEKASPPELAYVQKRAERLGDIGCAAEGAPYVILGILQRPAWLGNARGALVAARFLDEKHCPGAAKLPEDAKLKLQEIRDAKE